MRLDQSRPRNFFVEIDFDTSLREYRASFVNARYPVVMAAATQAALTGRVTRLVRRYFQATDASVVFGETRASRDRGARAA